jgi:hypothetical protein
MLDRYLHRTTKHQDELTISANGRKYLDRSAIFLEMRMPLPRRQQRLIEAIDHQLTGTDPRLAWLFSTFGRLWAGEPLPAREQLCTRAGGFWSSVREALAAGAWPVTGLPVTDASGAGRGSIPSAPDQARKAADGPGRNEQDDRWHIR